MLLPLRVIITVAVISAASIYYITHCLTEKYQLLQTPFTTHLFRSSSWYNSQQKDHLQNYSHHHQDLEVCYTQSIPDKYNRLLKIIIRNMKLYSCFKYILMQLKTFVQI